MKKPPMIKLVFDTSALISLEALELAKSICADYLVCDDYESFWYLTENFEKTVFSVFVVKHLCEKVFIASEEGWKLIETVRERRT